MKKELKKKIHIYLLIYIGVKITGAFIAGFGIYFLTSILFEKYLGVIFAFVSGLLYLMFSMRNSIQDISRLSGTGEELKNAYELLKKEVSDNPYTIKLLNLLYERVLINSISFSKYTRKLLAHLVPPFILTGMLIPVSITVKHYKEKARTIEYSGLVETAVVRVVRPAYTGLKEEQVYHLPYGRITVPEGSDVSISMKLSKRGKVSLKVCNEHSNSPYKEENGYYTLRIENLKEDCNVKVEVSYLRIKFQETPFEFIVKKDEEPSVEIIHPGRNLVLETPPDRFKIRFFAQDDYGISKVVLIYDIEGKWIEKIEKKVKGHPSSFEDIFTINLSKIPRGLKISYHVEVEDNDEINGYKRGFSETYYVYIPEEFTLHEELMKKIEVLFENTVKLLTLSISGPYDKIFDMSNRIISQSKSILPEAEGDEHLSLKLLDFLKTLPMRLKKLIAYTKNERYEEMLNHAEDTTYDFLLALRAQILASAYTIAEEIKKLLDELKTAKANRDKNAEKLLSMQLAKKFNKLRQLAQKLPKDILQENFNPDSLRYNEGTSISSYEQMLESLLKMIEAGGMQTSIAGNFQMYKKLKELMKEVQSVIEREVMLKEKTDELSAQCSAEGTSHVEGRRLADEQRSIRKDMQQILGEWGTRYPSLEEAERYMRYAEDTLKIGDFESSSKHEKNAIQNLHNLIEMLKDETERLKEGWRSISLFRETRRYSVNGALSIEKVEIPEEVERKETEEIRKEVMRIIKGGLPEKYKEENRKYYEELLR